MVLLLKAAAMSKTMENVKTINSVVRTAILLALLGIFAYLGYFVYAKYVQPGFEAERIRQAMNALQVRFDQQSEELAKTQTALKLIKVDHRKAFIKILEKGTEQNSGEPYFDVEFIEVDKAGRAISAPRQFRLRGSLMFVDSWVVKFDDKYIEQAEDLRGASLCVFKSIWGDIDGRKEGHSLDRVDGENRTAYETAEPMSEFERKIWEDFWEVANNPHRQAEMGIRANHGQVNYLRVEPGMVYEVDLRASDGLTLRASQEPVPVSDRPSG